jgi:hypothetical protein
LCINLCSQPHSLPDEAKAEKLLVEKKKVGKLSQVRKGVFGSGNGHLVPLSVLSGSRVSRLTTSMF